MRQRLALAAALLGEPRILILDEPANGLDPQGMRWLRDLLREQAAAGRTVLVSSHLLSEVAQTADELIVIRDGKLVAKASLDEFTTGRRARCGCAARTPETLAARAQPSRGASVEREDDGALLVERTERRARSATWRWPPGSRSTNWRRCAPASRSASSR